MAHQIEHIATILLARHLFRHSSFGAIRQPVSSVTAAIARIVKDQLMEAIARLMQPRWMCFDWRTSKDGSAVPPAVTWWS